MTSSFRAFVPILAAAFAGGCTGPTLGSRDASVDAVDGSADARSTDAGSADGGPADDAPGLDADLAMDAGLATDAGVDAFTGEDAGPGPCRTRITYGDAWIHPDGRDTDFDEVAGSVDWDGVCHRDGANSYAVLSNGWRPYFVGRACRIAIDRTGECATTSCGTRITYGAGWQRAPGHAADYDDVDGVVTWDGGCGSSGGLRTAELSNGWVPHFSGACEVALRYTGCGAVESRSGLFANPVVDRNCPDPGVAAIDDGYVMACTSGNAGAAFPLRTSSDLVTWRSRGHVFPSGTRPGWASGDFWAPEIHHVGDRWIAYYSARNAADGRLALGAAFADDPLGPYTDLGRPLLRDSNPGVIDTHYFETSSGERYLSWKRDGNAIGQPTPLFVQRVQADGVTLTGPRTQVLVNDRGWEGNVVEGAWVIERGGYFYLFYSANHFATSRYAVGVARSRSPTGPFTKASGPILTSNHAFAGPGHGSVVRGPDGGWVHVYHAWYADRIDASPGRVLLADRVSWRDGWPHMDARPTAGSQPHF